MRLSDIKGEEALDVLADIIEPLAMILADEEVQKISKQKNVNVLSYIKPMIKNHKKEVMIILARLENETPEEYAQKVTLLTLPIKLAEFINEPEVKSLFLSQEQNIIESSASSSPAMETTEAKGK